MALRLPYLLFKIFCGNFGSLLVAVTITLFALSTVMASYYYGESSLKYLKPKTNSLDIFILKLITLLVIVVGSIVSSHALWQAIDILVGILAIVNIYAIFSLRSIVMDEYRIYKRQKIH